jgi:putative glutamine amidotransferase
MERGRPPIVGITCDLAEAGGVLRAQVRPAYADAVRRAGGVPVLLQPDAACAADHARLCDAVVLTGGDDPATEPFGAPTHPAARLVHPARQAYEVALLAALEREHPEKPVLGVCLGMQMLALASAGALDQHLPDTTPTHADHWGDRRHTVRPTTPDAAWLAGEVTSHHRQAVSDPGAMRTVALAHDGVVEAIDDPRRPFVLGVQWHPERSGDGPLGLEIFRRLVAGVSSAHAL